MSSVTETRAKIQAAIWQAVAHSGVDVSAVPRKDLDTLVGAITTNVLEAVDSFLGEETGKPLARTVNQEDGVVAAADADDDGEEQLLWEGRPFLSLSITYQITNERLRIVEGIFSTERRDIELVRMHNIDHKQNLTERAMNMGDVFIRGHDTSDPEIVLHNVQDPAAVHEILRKAILEARKKYNVSFREEM